MHGPSLRSGKTEKDQERLAPCQLYSEPDLAERVVRDYLTEDIDRIFIDLELFESTRSVIQKWPSLA